MSASETRWPGQEELFRTALRLAQSGQVPHAWLLIGFAGLPAGPYADLLAAQVLCRAPTEQGPCLTCPSCAWVRGGVHPDWIGLAPEGLTIRVDHVREALSRAQYQAEAGPRRVVRIDAADRLGAEAAAALLKGMEEPPAGVVFVLSTDVPGRVPDTIRSRCLTFTLRAVPDEAIAAWLKDTGLTEEAAWRIARASDGYPGRAYDWASAAHQAQADGAGLGTEEETDRKDDAVAARIHALREAIRDALRSGRVTGRRAQELLDEVAYVEEALWRGIPGRVLADVLATLVVPSAGG